MLKKKSLRKTTINKHNSKAYFGNSGFSAAMVVALVSVLFSSLSTFAVSKWVEKERQDFEIFKEKWVQLTEVINYCSLFELSSHSIIYQNQIVYYYYDQFGRLVTTQKGPTKTVDSSIVIVPAILADSSSRFQLTVLINKWLSSTGILDFRVYEQLMLLRRFIAQYPFPKDYDVESIMNSVWGDSTVRNTYFRIIHELKNVAEKSLEKN